MKDSQVSIKVQGGGVYSVYCIPNIRDKILNERMCSFIRTFHLLFLYTKTTISAISGVNKKIHTY